MGAVVGRSSRDEWHPLVQQQIATGAIGGARPVRVSPPPTPGSAGAGGGLVDALLDEPGSPGPGSPTAAERNLQKILMAMMQSPPTLKSSTGTSVTVTWASASTNLEEMRLISRYELQWRQPCVRHQYSRRCQMPTCAQSGNVGSFFPVGGGEPAMRTCNLHWASVPAEAIQRFDRTVRIDGLLHSCQPMEFRVRARNHAGWAPYSEPSEFLQTYPSVYQPTPKALHVTFYSIELSWDALVHWSEPVSVYLQCVIRVYVSAHVLCATTKLRSLSHTPNPAP